MGEMSAFTFRGRSVEDQNHGQILGGIDSLRASRGTGAHRRGLKRMARKDGAGQFQGGATGPWKAK